MYVKGVVSKVDTANVYKYHNIAIYLSEEGQDEGEYAFEAYGCNYLENKPFETFDESMVKAGDKVVIYGTLKKYGTTYELDKGCYLYSLNNQTTSGISKIATSAAESVRYNLAGQKVGANYKGVVIENGKKIVVK